MMTPGTRGAFTQNFADPNRLFVVLSAVLIIVLAVSLIKVVFAAWHDHQHRTIEHNPLDLITLPLRMILILLFITLILYHS